MYKCRQCGQVISSALVIGVLCGLCHTEHEPGLMPMEMPEQPHNEISIERPQYFQTEVGVDPSSGPPFFGSTFLTSWNHLDEYRRKAAYYTNVMIPSFSTPLPLLVDSVEKT